MRLIAAVLAFISCNLFAESIDVQVSIPVEQHSQPVLLSKARVIAVRNALDKLPTVVWGTEQSNNGQYLEEIKAIGFAHADVTVIKEVIDKAQNTYTLDASVAFDYEKIMATLNTVKDGVRAKRAMEQIIKMVGAIDVNSLVTNRMIDAQLAAKLLTDPKYLSDDIVDQIEWNEKLFDQFKRIVKDRAVHYVRNISIKLTGMKAMRLEYHVTAPAYESILPEFDAPELNAFVKEHKTLLMKQQNICIAKTIEDVDKISAFSIDKPVDFTVTTAPDKDMVKKGIQPFIFYVCEESQG